MTDHRKTHEQTLALAGGSPVRTAPLPGWPQFGPEEIEAAAAVLRSGKVNYWTGPQGRLFEEEFARSLGCRYAVAVANGTAALELALHAVGVGPGDEVIVTCRSFIASAGCCLLRGAVPVFADVDADSQNITAESVQAVLTLRTKAIVAVHLAGWPCEMDSLLELARRRGLAVIEDCAQAHGATYRGRPVGSMGDVAAFSFCQDKILTTGGEGGMVATNDPLIWRKAWRFKDHGKSLEAIQNAESPGFKWVHQSIGTNWRLTEMQSAIGRVMLPKLGDWIEARRRNAAIMHRHFARLPALRVTPPPAHVRHAYYKYYAFLRPERLRPGWTRDRVIKAIQAEGVPCGSGICPEIYLEAAFDGSPVRPAKRLPVAKQLGQTSLMFLVHPALSEQDILDTCRATAKVLRAATRDDASTEAPAAKRAA